jgi:uncharacterized protein YjbJ (UPF0337 family)
VFYDPINDFCLKQCLKEKIGKFMERKERNAEGKTEKNVKDVRIFCDALHEKIVC